MTLNWKRLGLVLLFILMTIGIGMVIYFVFFKGLLGTDTNGNRNVNGGLFPDLNANRNVNGGVSNVNGGLPNINGDLGPTVVARGGDTTVSPVAKTLDGGATVANNGRDLIYYDPVTGKFYQISPDGTTRSLLSPDAYPAAEKVTWSPQKDKAILEFPDASKILYDVRNKRQYTLAPEMEDIVFSPSGDKLTFKFIGSDSDDRMLVVSNFDGSNATTVTPLADKASQFDVNWSPAGNVVALFTTSTSADRQTVVPVGILGENFRSFDPPGRGFESSYSPDGQHLLFSVFTKETGYNPTLYIADGTANTMGNDMIDLDVQTWPEKCTFGTGTSLYCAVPQYLEQGTGLFTDLAKDVPDDIYRIDLATGRKERIARPVDSNGDGQYSATNLKLSSDESILYFFDQRTGQMQKIQLR